jgi:phage baseplate assembly protein W
MAFRVSNIEPIDLQPRVAIGISLPFNGSTGFNSTYTTADQLKTNILSFLLTNKGERLYRPNFGANLRSLIFEQQTSFTIDQLSSIITSQVENQFPGVTVLDVNIDSQPDFNTINVSVSYGVANTNIQDQLTLAFNDIPLQ